MGESAVCGQNGDSVPTNNKSCRICSIMLKRDDLSFVMNKMPNLFAYFCLFGKAYRNTSIRGHSYFGRFVHLGTNLQTFPRAQKHVLIFLFINAIAYHQARNTEGCMGEDHLGDQIHH